MMRIRPSRVSFDATTTDPTRNETTTSRTDIETIEKIDENRHATNLANDHLIDARNDAMIREDADKYRISLQRV
jgi:hypothetical protein